MIFFPIWLLQPPSPQEWGREVYRGSWLPPIFSEIVFCQGCFPGNFLSCHSPRHPKLFWPRHFQSLVGGPVLLLQHWKISGTGGCLESCFVFLKIWFALFIWNTRFWDSTFCLITDELCFEIISNIKFWKSWYFEYTKLKLRHGSFPGRFSTWLAEKMAERCIGYSIVSAWIKCKIISLLMTSIEMCLLSTRSLNDITISNTSTINVEF